MPETFDRAATVESYNTAFTNYINSPSAPIEQAAKEYLQLNPYTTAQVKKDQDTQFVNSIFTEIEAKLPNLIPAPVQPEDLWGTIKQKIKDELMAIDNPDYPATSSIKYLIVDKA